MELLMEAGIMKEARLNGLMDKASEILAVAVSSIKTARTRS